MNRVETRRGMGLAVHILTASGVVWALLALLAATERDWALMFVWLGVAMIVDAADGPLARYFDVRETLPNWDGTVLDLVVDYLTYVFVPAYAAVAAGLFPDGTNVFAGAVICLSSVFFFGYKNQKTTDNFFYGFPTIWNVIVFYFFAFQAPGPINLVIVLALAALTFAPVAFVHPVRVKRLRPVTLAMTLVWAVSAIAAVAQDMAPATWALWGLGITAIYFLGVGLVRTVRGN